MESGEHEESVTVSLPIDAEGFLRRACPECAREFKVLADDGDENEADEEVPGLDEFCPYCRAKSDEWITPAQLEWATAQATNQVLEPLVDEFEENVKSNDSGFLQIGVDWSPAEAEEPLEPNDMERVEFECHPDEPVKILDGWAGGVHCHQCGQLRD